MKTIEVSDEMYDSLMELSKEMTSQDMLGTRMPHMFQIKTEKQVAAYPGCGYEVWVESDGEELSSDSEIREYISKYIYENDEDISRLDDDEAEKLAKEKVADMDEWDIKSWLEEKEWWGVEVTTESKYENTFFTSKACQEHIDANHYHYKNPRVFLNHAWRNPEQELVSRFLCELSGGKLHT